MKVRPKSDDTLCPKCMSDPLRCEKHREAVFGSEPLRPIVPANCPMCNVSDKPAHVAWELGFVAGFASAESAETKKTVLDRLCEPHAAMLVRVLANRVKG